MCLFHHIVLSHSEEKDKQMNEHRKEMDNILNKSSWQSRQQQEKEKDTGAIIWKETANEKTV